MSDLERSAAAGYLSGFGNHHATEALPGALPQGQNSPQRVPFGLYAEQLSGTAFTAPRHLNRRSWLYRMRPSAMQPPFSEYQGQLRVHGAGEDMPVTPNRLRWDPVPMPQASTDFVDGLQAFAGNGGPATGQGIGIYIYVANRSMQARVFSSADGELLFVPQDGEIALITELGRLEVAPGHIAVIPRGVRFRVELQGTAARGYVCENYGAMFALPELGPIGANGLANSRDFLTPRACFEDRDEATELIHKFQGRLWSTTLDHSPLDVVAWHGNLAPYRYDLRLFNTVNTVSYDHPDPSIFTVLTSPSELPGVANCDFVIFPPRWMVAEHTFRPPWFHRNVMSEFMGLLYGPYDAKAAGFEPGGASLHNCMSAHGPDRDSYQRAVDSELAPHKIENSLAFMFESRWAIRPTRHAMESALRQSGYDRCWDGFAKAQVPR